MLTLVKTVKRANIDCDIDWDSMSHKISGIVKIEENLVGMKFRKEGYGDTRLAAMKYSDSIMLSTIHVDGLRVSDVDVNYEQYLIDSILNSCSDKHKTIHTDICYLVYSIKPEFDIDIMVLEYKLRINGFKTLMDFSLHGAVVVEVGNVTIHLFNSGKILASATRMGVLYASEIVLKTWSKIMEYK